MAYASARWNTSRLCNCYWSPESVRTFIELTALQLGWEGIKWIGEGVDEVGKRVDTDEIVIRIDPRYFRPSEVQTLLGDPTKAQNDLGWKPTTTLEELIAEMVAHDLAEARKESYLKKNGYKVVPSLENPPNSL